jgi:hypothetical protein
LDIAGAWRWVDYDRRQVPPIPDIIDAPDYPGNGLVHSTGNSLLLIPQLLSRPSGLPSGFEFLGCDIPGGNEKLH